MRLLYTERANAENGIFDCRWLDYPKERSTFDIWFFHAKHTPPTEFSLTYEGARYLYRQLRTKFEKEDTNE